MIWLGDDQGRKPWTVRTILVIAVLVSCISGALIGWMIKPTDPPPGASAPLVDPTKEEKQAGPKEDLVPARPIRKVPAKVKPPLGLPQTVQDDPKQHVLTTAKLTAEARDYTLSAVLNEANGDTTIYARPDPLPWLGKATETALAVGYVLRDTGPAWRVKARQDFMRSKQVYAYAEAQVDQDLARSVGVFAEWRW